MKRLRLFLLLLAFPAACSQIPALKQVSETPLLTDAACAAVFPQGDWQLLHAIEAKPPGMSKQTFLGLSQISSTQRTAHCVMMTLEGMILFEADYDGTIKIERAVPPFDRPGMAQGIIDDLRLIFFTPDISVAQVGISENDTRICRYIAADATYDIEIKSADQWTVRRYNASGRKIRTLHPVTDKGRSPRGMPRQIVLEAHGAAGYRLTLSLIEAEQLERPPKP